MKKDNWITVKEASEVLDVTEQMIRNYIKSEKIVGQKVGRSWKIDPDSLEQKPKEQNRDKTVSLDAEISDLDMNDTREITPTVRNIQSELEAMKQKLHKTCDEIANISHEVETIKNDATEIKGELDILNEFGEKVNMFSACQNEMENQVASQTTALETLQNEIDAMKEQHKQPTLPKQMTMLTKPSPGMSLMRFVEAEVSTQVSNLIGRIDKLEETVHSNENKTSSWFTEMFRAIGKNLGLSGA